MLVLSMPNLLLATFQPEIPGGIEMEIHRGIGVELENKSEINTTKRRQGSSSGSAPEATLSR